MKNVHRQVARISKMRFPVLVLGETGTGKDLVANAIHQMDLRGPFVVVDCASLVGPLMESEIFGYTRGAFTGAHTNKLGLLDAAHGGTAFFDEIGELPLDLQTKLLRVLQSNEFRAVGAVGQRTSNFRLIAATNRDLAKEVEAKRFRQDLYYRLNVIRLRLPPLRDRKEDIPTLLAHFLGRHGNGHKISTDLMARLIDYPWPGNVRELEHAVQQMVSMNSGPWLSIADLPSTLVNNHWERSIDEGGAVLSQASGGGSNESILPLEDVIRKSILRALETTKGDRTLASQMLGIGRTTLYRKLKEYGMQD